MGKSGGESLNAGERERGDGGHSENILIKYLYSFDLSESHTHIHQTSVWLLSTFAGLKVELHYVSHQNNHYIGGLY